MKYIYIYIHIKSINKLWLRTKAVLGSFILSIKHEHEKV
jgi:hypothetical protein